MRAGVGSGFGSCDSVVVGWDEAGCVAALVAG